MDDGGSSHGSAHSSGMGSGMGSQASSHLSGKSKRNMSVMERAAVFPFLMQLTMGIDWKLSILGMIIDAIQLVALVLNPTQGKGAFLDGPFAQILYFFVSPFFDTRWADAQVVSHVAFWAAAAMVIAIIIGALANLNSEHQTMPVALQHVVRVCIHSLTSFLLLPATMALSAYLVCNKGRNHLYWFPSEDCRGGLASAYFAVASLSLSVILVCAYVAAGTLFDDNSEVGVRSINARATSSVTQARAALKIALGVSFHVLISQELPQVFAGVVAAVCFLLAVLYAVIMPYFGERINRWMSGTAMGACFVAIIVAVSHSSDSLAESTTLAIVAACTWVGGLLVGSAMVSIRINGEHSRAAAQIQRGKIFDDPEPHYPRNLPVGDLAFSRHKNLEFDINPLQHGGQRYYGDEEEEEEEETPETGLMHPYISAVHFESDVELANRFLNTYRDLSDNPPTDTMKAMGARIFTKGLAKFRRSAEVTLQFCWFLFNTVSRHRVALNEAELITKYDPSFSLQFRVYHLTLGLKSQLNMADTSHLKLFNSTLRLHKEILGQMSHFWSRLLAQNVDTVQLATIANTITSKREQAVSQYGRVLMHPNNTVLNRYARFLEQVMLDTASARQIKDQLAEQAEQRRRKVMGDHTSGKGSQMKSVASSAAQALNMLSKTTASTGSSTTIQRLSNSINAMFFMLLLVVIVFFVYGALRTSEAHATVDKIFAAGRVRSLVSLGGYYVSEIERELTVTGNTSARVGPLQNSLQVVSSDLYNFHSELIVGSLQSSFEAQKTFMRATRVEVFEPEESGTSLSGTYNRKLVDLFNLVNRIASTFSSIATANDTATLSSRDFELLRLNVLDRFAQALDASIELYAREADRNDGVAFWSATIVFGFGVIVVFAVYCIMVLNFNKIGAAKLSTLNLFTLIPRTHLEALHKNSVDMINTFDEEESESKEPSLGQHDDDTGSSSDEKSTLSRHSSARGASTAKVAPQAQGEKNAGSALAAKGVPSAWDTSDGKKRRKSRSGFGDSDDELMAESEDDEDAAETSKTDSKGGLTIMDVVSGIIFAFAIAAMLTVSATTLALVVRMEETSMAISGAQDNYGSKVEFRNSLYSGVLRLSHEARMYVENANPTHVKAYRDLLNEEIVSKPYRDLIASENDDGVLKILVEEMRPITDQLRLRQEAAIWLVANATNLDSVYRQYLRYPSDYNFTKMKANVDQTFFTFAISPSPYPASDYAADGAQNTTTQRQIARALMFDDTYEAHFELVERLRRDTRTTMEAYIDKEDKSRRTAFIAALCLYGFCLLLVAVCLVWLNFVSEAHALRAICTVTGCLVLVCVVMSSVMYVQGPEVALKEDRLVNFHNSRNATEASIFFTQQYARGFAQFGADSYFNRYQKVAKSSAWEHSISELTRLFLTSASPDPSEREKVISDVLSLRRLGEKVLALVEYSVVQSIFGFNYTSQATYAPYVDIKFDRSRERDREEDAIRFGFNDSDIYVNETYFAASRNSTEKTAVARATLSNSRFREALAQYSEAFESLAHRVSSALRKDADNEINQLSNLADGSVGVSAATLIVMVLCGMYVAFVLVFSMTQGDDKQRSSRKGNMFGRLLTQTRLALLVVLAALIAVYVFNLVVLSRFPRTVENLDTASSREWGIARTMNFAQQLWYGTSTDVPEPIFTRLSRELSRTRTKLFLGVVGEPYNLINSQSLNDQLFGSSTYNQEAFKSECAVGTASSAAGTFPDGVDAGYVQWIMWLEQIAKSYDRDAAITLRPDMVTSVVPLFDAILTSTKDIHDMAHSSIDSNAAAHYGITAGITVAVIIAFFAVFRPMIVHLLKEEEGTKMLLRMIPQAVRQDVPAIAEYLETGQITQNEKMQRINDAVTDLSTVSLLVIDFHGTVLRMSRATEELFGYDADEVIGRNIKMLMPEEIAVHHDEYLANYRKTGVKRVLDTVRRLTGKHKDGTTVPVEVTAREFRISASESNFLGFLRNISTDIQMEAATRLNEAVSDMNHIPVIVINPAGSICRVNRAACDTFMYQATEVVNKNVKMLMPTRFAKEHDGILARYQRTRQKNVIDSIRRVQALRSNGEEFQVELMIKEMLTERGETQFFVGYAKDITDDLRFQQSLLANEAVIHISPTPVISINPTGQVLIFSPAAASAWGYEPEEVVGRNIRMLMTEENAKHHDGYLARYMKTGQKHIIDSTRIVPCKRKDGTIFNGEANIKELRSDDSVTFIAYMRDLTTQQSMERAYRSNQIALSSCPLPIITMNDYGTVASFNVAAERTLGFRSEQVVGQNIKMLMPKAIADEHDGYLQRYRETGIKSIIDSKRRTNAVTRAGKTLNIEIQVREVTVEDILSKEGKKRLFVGYLRDVSEEMRMLKANQVNDAISDLCTVPMISIDTKGTILTFNSAASNEFKYEMVEVVGQNVKMLQPDHIAAKHDSYLSRYLKSGVKRVIDSTREVTAKRKDGTMFPCEIKVKEVLKSGMETVYVGYCRNTTNEIAIADSQLLVQTVIDTSPTPIISMDIRGTIKNFSKEAQRVFGWPQEDVIGKNIKMLMPKEIARNHDQYLKAYKKSGVKTIIDSTRNLTALRRDGMTLSMEIMVKEVRPQGKENDEEIPDDVLFVGYVRDKSQEYILRQSNELKDVILNQSSVPMLQIDTIGTIKFVNPAACAEFEYTEEELLGSNIKMLTPKGIRENHDFYLQRYHDTGVKRVVDTIRRVSAERKSGTIFPIEISVRELTINGEKTFFGYIRNITENLKIEDAKLLGDTMVDQSATPLIVIDDIGTVEVFNRAASKCFGYSSAEVLGKNIKMLQPAEVAAIHDEYLANYKKYRVKSVIDTTRRVMGRRKNGRPFPLEIMVREVQGSGSTRSSYIGYLRDVTDEFRLKVANELADAVSILSPIPLIGMDELGVVTKFSKAAEDQFGWQADEVIGKNIKMLQPPDIAAAHDGYLRRYRETGVKAVIDTTRRVNAKHRDGTHFPIEITVREIQKEGVERQFVGFARDLRGDIEMEQQTKINTITTNLMATPLIVISEDGTIASANKAVEQVFGYPSTSLVNQNVKMLMPERISVNHDGYLSKYKETGVKSVVDSKRVVPGRRSDGSEVQVEIMVREMYSQDLDKKFFFGFLRELTQDFAVEHAFRLNDTVTMLSLVPIIVINSKGSLLMFSEAASRTFGYDPKEVMGKNIKMLMPEHYAKNHDGYLAKYAETGIKNVIDSVRNVDAKRKSGEVFKAQIAVHEISMKNEGNAYVGFLTDMTDKLNQQDDGLVSDIISELSNVALLMINGEGTVSKANNFVHQVLGYSPEELIGKNLKMIMPNDIADRHDGYLQAYRRTGVKHVIDRVTRSRARHKNGNVILVEIGIREVNVAGMPQQFIGFVRDVTLDARLEEADRINASVLSLSPYPIILIDHIGTIIQFSELGAKFFGYRPEQVIGKNIKMLQPERIAAQHDKYLQQYLATGEKHVIDEERTTTARRADGKEVRIAISVKEIKATGGQLYFLGYIKPLE